MHYRKDALNFKPIHNNIYVIKFVFNKDDDEHFESDLKHF